MVTLKTKLESEFLNLAKDLEDANIPPAVRQALSQRVMECETKFQTDYDNESVIQACKNELDKIDLEFTFAVIAQAQHEISKKAKMEACNQALENVRKEVEQNRLAPLRARHEVKNLMRKY